MTPCQLVNIHRRFGRLAAFRATAIVDYQTTQRHSSDLNLHGRTVLFLYIGIFNHVRWVPVTAAWRVLRLRMEERPPMWRVAANKLNKQSRTADEGWSSSLGVRRGANNASP